MTEVIPGMTKLLMEMEWLPVRCKSSGILFKNGFVLVIGGNEPQPNTQSESDCIANVAVNFNASMIHGKLNGYFIEKNGYVVSIGSITNTAASAFTSAATFKAKQELKYLLNRINGVPDMAETALDSNCSGYAEVSMQKNVTRFVAVNKKLSETMKFAVISDKLNLPSGCYGVVSLDNGVIGCVRVTVDDHGTLLLLDGIRRDVDVDQLRDWKKRGDVQIVDGIRKNITVREKVFTKTHFSHYGLPSSLHKFGLKRVELESMVSAVRMCANITPLLRGYDEVSEAFSKSLCVPILGLEKICMIKAESETMDLLAGVIQQQLNVNDFYTNDRELLSMRLQDFDNLWNDVKNGLCISADEEWQARIMLSYNYQLQENIHEQFLIFRGKQFGLEPLAQRLLQDGNYYDKVYMIGFECLSVEEKQLLFEYFSYAELSIAGYAWSDLLSSVFDQAQYLRFDPQLGFLINTAYANFGRDDNSIVAYYNEGLPRWRGLSISGENISYGDDKLITESLLRCC